MTKPNTRTNRGPDLRRLWRAVAGTTAALVLIIGMSLAAGACTLEWGGKTSSTATSAVAGAGDTGSANNTEGTPPSVNVVPSGDGLASPAQNVATILGPSVVNIISTPGAESSQGPWQQNNGPYEGSGVIYSGDGMIITNNHMVRDDYSGDVITDVQVTLATGEKLPATVVGTDPLTDLAVVKVNAGMDLPAATFVTELPAVGEYAVAIGSPLGYENSVTLGIVSGLDRSIEDVLGTTIDAIAYNHLIQTDAPISPGNSGGALANASGQVIGINVAYEPPETGAVSIGFAIPAEVVTEVADEIIGMGNPAHVYLGVRTRAVTSDLQQQFGLSLSAGILVVEVIQDTPASKAGIQQGDIITEVDDEKMTHDNDLAVYMRDKNPGEKIDVTIDRNGTTSVMSVTLEVRPANW